MICTFFGHSDTPLEAEPLLRKTLIWLIQEKDVKLFYVGNHGNFDKMVRKNLKELTFLYPHIRYAVVLAYLPSTSDCEDFSDTIYPDGMEHIPFKYAIIKRNEWMIEKSDYVITYVKRTRGGAARFKQIAERKNKYVINIAE